MYHKNGAYDGFDALSEVPGHYRRRRKVQDFILSDTGVMADKPKCCHCGKRITIKDGNRGEFHPRSGEIRIMHYYCAWMDLSKDFSSLI